MLMSQLNKRTLTGLSRRLFTTAPAAGGAKPAAPVAAAAPSPPPAAAAAPAAPPAPVYSTLPANFAALSPKEKMEISKKNAASINKYFDSLAPAGYDTQIMENMQVDEKNIDYSSQHVLEGTPMNYLGRKARVEPATYKSLQSSWGRSHRWVVFFDTCDQGQRWSNTMTGWTSSNDALSNIRVYFDSREDAIKYCEAQSWKYNVAEEHHQHDPDQDALKYDENFLSRKVKLMAKHCGPDFYREWFQNPKYGNSHWFMPITFHGDKEVEQHGPRQKQ